MSESTFPFNAPAEPAPFEDDAESGRNRKQLFVLGGVLGAVVLGAGGFFLLGGDDAEEDFTVPVRTPQAAAPAEPAPVAVVPAASTEQIGRNPFKAMYVEPEAAPATQPTETTAAGQQSVSLTGGQQPVSTSTVASAQYPLTLVSISEPMPEARTFVFRYDDKDVTVLPAQRFGKHGELVVLAYTMDEASKVTGAVLQVGDASPITVSIGETISVL